MVWVAGGRFHMGSDRHYPEEAPVRAITVDGFWIDRHAVTNADFAHFVAATGYVTVAERPLDPAAYPGALPELLRPGGIVFDQPTKPVDMRNWGNWWAYRPGAQWRRPLGPSSPIAGRGQDPVVQIAFEDAAAYAAWAGKDLPTETEWEYAARGGLDGATYAWGEELTPNGRWMANVWQGEFPWRDLAADGFPGLAPVGSFPANNYGLYDMTGNTWEWTRDWYGARRPAEETGTNASKPCCGPSRPRSPTEADSIDPTTPGVRIPRKVIKGGSYLCAPNYCLRYRPAARQAQAIDTATCHIGFRCVIRPHPLSAGDPAKHQTTTREGSP